MDANKMRMNTNGKEIIPCGVMPSVSDLHTILEQHGRSRKPLSQNAKLWRRARMKAMVTDYLRKLGHVINRHVMHQNISGAVYLEMSSEYVPSNITEYVECVLSIFQGTMTVYLPCQMLQESVISKVLPAATDAEQFSSLRALIAEILADPIFLQQHIILRALTRIPPDVMQQKLCAHTPLCDGGISSHAGQLTTLSVQAVLGDSSYPIAVIIDRKLLQRLSVYARLRFGDRSNNHCLTNHTTQIQAKTHWKLIASFPMPSVFWASQLKIGEKVWVASLGEQYNALQYINQKNETRLSFEFRPEGAPIPTMTAPAHISLLSNGILQNPGKICLQAVF